MREPGVRLLERAKTMKIGANLTEEETKAFKARKELELAGVCGGEWCVDVYRSGGRWLARAYRKGERTRGPKPGTKYRPRKKQQHETSGQTQTGSATYAFEKCHSGVTLFRAGIASFSCAVGVRPEPAPGGGVK